jgi:hypothetical protein
LVKNIAKTFNPIILPSKFGSTILCPHLSLDVAQFPSVMENNIQIRNICPIEVGSNNTKFENNKKL